MHTGSYGGFRTEIHRRALHRQDFSGSHVGTVYRRIAVGIDGKQMVENRATGISRQIEIRMVGHVDNRRSIGRRLISDDDGIVVGKIISNFRFYISREILISIGRVHHKFERFPVELPGFVHFILPAFRTSVQAVAEIVLRQLYGIAVDDKATVVDAVGITTHRSTEVRRNIHIIIDVIKSQNDIAHFAVTVGNHDRDDTSAEIGNAYLHARGVFQCIKSNLFSIDDGCKVRRIQTRKCFIRLLRTSSQQEGQCRNKKSVCFHVDIKINVMSKQYRFMNGVKITLIFIAYSQNNMFCNIKRIFFLSFFFFRQNCMMIVFTYFPDVSRINIKSPSIPAGIEGLFV